MSGGPSSSTWTFGRKAESGFRLQWLDAETLMGQAGSAAALDILWKARRNDDTALLAKVAPWVDETRLQEAAGAFDRLRDDLGAQGIDRFAEASGSHLRTLAWLGRWQDLVDAGRRRFGAGPDCGVTTGLIAVACWKLGREADALRWAQGPWRFRDREQHWVLARDFERRGQPEMAALHDAKAEISLDPGSYVARATLSLLVLLIGFVTAGWLFVLSWRTAWMVLTLPVLLLTGILALLMLAGVISNLRSGPEYRAGVRRILGETP